MHPVRAASTTVGTVLMAVIPAAETVAVTAAKASDRSDATAGLIPVFDFHPGEPHVRLFSCLSANVLRHDRVAFVSEALYGDRILRHYAFAEEWFKINVTTDRLGGIVETTPPVAVPAFAFNCDIATPMLHSGGAVHAAVHAVDLGVEVLVRRDGTTFEIVDLADLDAALSNGLISAREHRYGVEGLARLIDLIQRNGLVPFLSDVCPFGPTSASPATPMRLVPVSDVPLLRPGQRPTW